MKKIFTIVLSLALMVTATGCDDWLDIRPETEVNEDDMFKDEQGFMDALYGVYVNLGKSDLYGGTLQTALDMTAQLYNYYDIADCPYGRFKTFEYENPQCATIVDNLWMRSYYCIDLVNNILKYLDKPESQGICANYNYIRGESLALRAYMHFELVRIFAPDVKDKPDYVSIPYRKVFSPDIDPQLKVSDVYARIIDDLEEAKDLLKEDVICTSHPDWLGVQDEVKENDDVTEQNNKYYVTSFLKNRKYRMNYYAVLGTLARVYLTMGDTEKAYECAMKVIMSGKFRPIQKENLQVSGDNAKYRDILFTDEFIFGLYSNAVDGFYKSHFDESYGPNKMMVSNLRTIYGSNSRDSRQTYWYKTIWGSSYLLKHQADLAYSKEKVRMITLPEMYYIAAEAHPSEAFQLLEKILPSRNIHSTLGDVPSRDEVLKEILKEYRKEYVGDGLFFHACKRLMNEPGLLNGLGVNIPNEDRVLVWPLPQDEIKYGDRESEIWQNK